MKCMDCKYFGCDTAGTRSSKIPPSKNEIDWGYCHRWPPIFRIDSSGDKILEELSEHIGVWLDDWCGEFKQGEKP